MEKGEGLRVKKNGVNEVNRVNVVNEENERTRIEDRGRGKEEKKKKKKCEEVRWKREKC